MVWALHPKVAIMNNGPTTGGAVGAWQTIHDSPGLLDLWQLHFASANGPTHNSPEALIANLVQDSDYCQGAWIQLTASQDGAFTVQNGRTHFSKSYH
jgi:hypothetical protein